MGGQTVFCLLTLCLRLKGHNLVTYFLGLKMTNIKPAIRLAQLIKYAKGNSNRKKAVHHWCQAIKWCLSQGTK
mgnify:CR=1 FL=1